MENTENKMENVTNEAVATIPEELTLESLNKRVDALEKMYTYAINNHGDFINAMLDYLRGKFPDDFPKPEEEEKPKEEPAETPAE